MHRNDVFLHHILHQIVVLGKQQILDCRDADQAVVAVVDVAGVDGLLIHTGTADTLDRHFRRHIRPQRDELGRHDRAGAVLRIFEQFVDLTARFLVCLSQNTLDDIRRHFLDQIYRVVHKELVNDLFELAVRESVDQKLLGFVVHLDEGFSRQLLGQDPEQDRQLFILQLLKNRRDIVRLHGRQDVSEGAVLLFLQQHPDGFRKRYVNLNHCVLPPQISVVERRVR